MVRMLNQYDIPIPHGPHRRLVVGTSPSPEDLIPLDLQPNSNKVQQLDVWFPGEMELALFMFVHLLVYDQLSSNIGVILNPSIYIVYTHQLIIWHGRYSPLQIGFGRSSSWGYCLFK